MKKPPKLTSEKNIKKRSNGKMKKKKKNKVRGVLKYLKVCIN